MVFQDSVLNNRDDKEKGNECGYIDELLLYVAYVLEGNERALNSFPRATVTVLKISIPAVLSGAT